MVEGEREISCSSNPCYRKVKLFCTHYTSYQLVNILESWISLNGESNNPIVWYEDEQKVGCQVEISVGGRAKQIKRSVADSRRLF